jgi:exonuclease VII large subunit
MTTLIDYYQELKESLKSHLKNNQTPEIIVKIIQTEINQIIDINSEYIQTLTPPQARLARAMLQSISQYTSVLLLVQPENNLNHLVNNQQTTLNEFTANLVKPISNLIQTQQKLQDIVSPSYYKQAIIQTVQKSREVFSSSLAGGLAGIIEGGWYWGIIGVIIGGVTGGTISQIIKQKPSSETANIEILQQPNQQPQITINTDKLLDYLYQSFQSIEITVAAQKQSTEKTPKSGLENNLDLLEYLQDLMADALDEKTELPITVRRRIEQAATILRHYGIETRVYQPSKEQDLMFYFEPSLNPEITDYITLKHALIKDNQILLPGSVIEPSSSN